MAGILDFLAAFNPVAYQGVQPGAGILAQNPMWQNQTQFPNSGMEAAPVPAATMMADQPQMPANAQPAQAPMPMAPQDGGKSLLQSLTSGTPLSGIGDWAAGNRNTLMALAAGFAGAPSFGDGMRRAFSNAQAGSYMDQNAAGQSAAQQRDVAQQNATYRWLVEQKNMDPNQALALLGNKQALASVMSGGRNIAVAPGSAIVNPETGSVVYQAPGGSGDIGSLTAQRASEAEKFGLDPRSAAGQAYILTGKMPREDQNPLTATDKKAILEADEMVSASQGALPLIQRAKELSPDAYSGAAAPLRAWVGNNLPDAVVPDFIASPKASAATSELNNVATEQALSQLKTIFGAAPTEGERALLMEISGSASQPKAVRDAIYERAQQAVARRLEFNKQRANELRGGTFYQQGGGGQPAPQPPPAASAPQGAPSVGAVQQGFRFKGGDPANPASWEKVQ